MFFKRALLCVLCVLGASASRPSHASPQAKFTLSPSAIEAAVAFWKTYSVDSKVETLETTDWLADGPHAIETGLWAVSLSSEGRKVLAELLPLYLKKKIRFASTRSIEAIRLVGRVNAGGIYHGGVIYIDDQAPLLAFAGTFFHEMVHARDYLTTEEGREQGKAMQAFNEQSARLRARRAAGDSPTEEETRHFLADRKALTPALLASEHRAYEAQNRFLSDFIKMEAGFGAVVEELVNRQFYYAYPMREFDFEYLMTHPNGANLSGSTVGAYLKEHPFRGSR